MTKYKIRIKKPLLLFAILSIFLFQNAKSQSMPEQDCINAIEICDTFYLQTNSYIGPGNIPIEVNSSHLCDGGSVQAGYIETNSVWYRLKVLSTGTLNFTLFPLAVTDDYDWAIYDITNANCDQIFFNPNLRIACNRSAIPGPTGANGLAGNQNAPILNVTAGQILVFNINNFSSTQSGYIFSLGKSTAAFLDTIAPTIIGAEHVCNNYGVRLYTSELVKCNSIDADGIDFKANVVGNTTNIVIGAVGVGCSASQLYTNIIDVEVDPNQITATADVRVRLNKDIFGNPMSTVVDKCDNAIEVLDTIVSVNPQPKLPNLGADLFYCLIDFSFPTLDPQVNATSYIWNTGAETPTIQATSPGLYWVEVGYNVTADPCIRRDSIIIEAAMEYCADNLPNAFTPNGDGFNETYAPGLNSYLADPYNIELTILNRWGQVLYTGKKEWDGNYNGSPVENGTYFAVIKYFDISDGKDKVFKTPVTLIRK